MNMRSLPWKGVVTYLHIYIAGREEIRGEIGICIKLWKMITPVN
jgi:hypothetical protein